MLPASPWLVCSLAALPPTVVVAVAIGHELAAFYIGGCVMLQLCLMRAARGGPCRWPGRGPWLLSVLMSDADHFKQISDHHGHLAGDECLKQRSAALRSNRVAVAPQPASAAVPTAALHVEPQAMKRTSRSPWA